MARGQQYVRLRTLFGGRGRAARAGAFRSALRLYRLRLAVRLLTLPVGWRCAAVDFFNQINMLYGTITEFCTPQECPVMSAGPKYAPTVSVRARSVRA
jgi:hypothetical protein